MFESRGEIHIRPVLHGVRFDVVTWTRFVTLPVLDAGVLAGSRESYRYLTYLDRQAGHPVPDDLPGVDRPDLVGAFTADAAAWLHGGAA